MKLKTVHYIFLGIISSILIIQIHTMIFTFTEYLFPKNTTIVEQRKVDFLPKPSFIKFDQEKDLKQARRRGGRGGGIIIDIRDEDGEITTWGFWLINILAPFFVIGEIVKLVISLIVLPFSTSLANSFFQGAINNIIAMSPGLIFYVLGGCILGNLEDSNEEEKETHHKAVSDPNTSPKKLQHDVRSGVASNPNTPPENLQQLARDHSQAVRSGVASNPNTPLENLQQLARDEHWVVRSGVASNPNTPLEFLQKLTRDEDRKVREGVASNLNTPLENLQQLAQDQNQFVRKEANKTLREKST